MSPPTRPPPRNNRGSSRPAAGGAGAFRRTRVADVGCGHGASTLLADAYPSSEIVGFDAHDGSIQAARKRAADAGLTDRVSFEVASATTSSERQRRPCAALRWPGRTAHTVEQKRSAH
jgi:predicted RNA methylase